MIRTNLSTRPFYNERLVHLALGLAGLVVLALSVWNLFNVVQLSRQNTTLATRISEDRRAAEDYTRKARQTRQGINVEELKLVVAKAREANALIDSRTFSWTQFFNYIETTLPPEVMLASVRPAVDEKGTHISMVVLARNPADIQEFMDKLEATGAFEDILPKQRTENDNGLHQANVETLYVPEAAAADTQPPSPPPVQKPQEKERAR
jgi:hypothetical protein